MARRSAGSARTARCRRVRRRGARAPARGRRRGPGPFRRPARTRVRAPAALHRHGRHPRRGRDCGRREQQPRPPRTGPARAERPGRGSGARGCACGEVKSTAMQGVGARGSGRARRGHPRGRHRRMRAGGQVERGSQPLRLPRRGGARLRRAGRRRLAVGADRRPRRARHPRLARRVGCPDGRACDRRLLGPQPLLLDPSACSRLGRVGQGERRQRLGGSGHARAHRAPRVGDAAAPLQRRRGQPVAADLHRCCGGDRTRRARRRQRPLACHRRRPHAAQRRRHDPLERGVRLPGCRARALEPHHPGRLAGRPRRAGRRPRRGCDRAPGRLRGTGPGRVRGGHRRELWITRRADAQRHRPRSGARAPRHQRPRGPAGRSSAPRPLQCARAAGAERRHAGAHRRSRRGRPDLLQPGDRAGVQLPRPRRSLGPPPDGRTDCCGRWRLSGAHGSCARAQRGAPRAGVDGGRDAALERSRAPAVRHAAGSRHPTTT